MVFSVLSHTLSHFEFTSQEQLHIFQAQATLNHECRIDAKSAVACLTSEKSAIVCLEFAQTAVCSGVKPTPSLSLSPWNMT